MNKSEKKTSHSRHKLFIQQGNMPLKLLSPKNDLAKKGSSKDYRGKPITEIISNGFFSVALSGLDPEVGLSSPKEMSDAP